VRSKTLSKPILSKTQIESVSVTALNTYVSVSATEIATANVSTSGIAAVSFAYAA